MNTTRRSDTYEVTEREGGFGIRNTTVGQDLLVWWSKRELAYKFCLGLTSNSKPLRSQFDALAAITAAGEDGITVAVFAVAYYGPKLVKELGTNKAGKPRAEARGLAYLRSLHNRGLVAGTLAIKKNKAGKEQTVIDAPFFVAPEGKATLEVWNDYRRLWGRDKWRGNSSTARRPTAAA